MRRLLTVLLVAGAALAASVAPASAHNVLTGSDPKDGARLATVPASVTLTFDQPVRADFAQVAVTGPDGAVGRPKVKVVDNKVTAVLPPAAVAGAYIVGYQIVSNDGHPVTGKIGFTVTGGSAAGSPGSPAPSAGSAPTGIPTVQGRPPVERPTVAAAAPAGGGSWVWGLLVAALLLSGAGIRVVARHGRQVKGHGA